MTTAKEKLDELLSRQSDFVGLYQLRDLGLEPSSELGIEPWHLGDGRVFEKKGGSAYSSPDCSIWPWYLWAHDEQGRLRALMIWSTSLDIAGLTELMPNNHYIVAPANCPFTEFPEGMVVYRDERPLSAIPRQQLRHHATGNAFQSASVLESIRLGAWLTADVEHTSKSLKEAVDKGFISQEECGELKGFPPELIDPIRRASY